MSHKEENVPTKNRLKCSSHPSSASRPKSTKLRGTAEYNLNITYTKPEKTALVKNHPGYSAWVMDFKLLHNMPRLILL